MADFHKNGACWRLATDNDVKVTNESVCFSFKGYVVLSHVSDAKFPITVAPIIIMLISHQSFVPLCP